LVLQHADPFSFILQDYYGMSMIPAVCDMVEEAIGVLEDPRFGEPGPPGGSVAQSVKLGKRTGVLLEAARNLGQRDESRQEPDFPEKVTLSWLIRHVPISFWFWLGGIVVAAFAAGLQVAELLAH
jgi:hypothetical protein